MSFNYIRKMPIVEDIKAKIPMTEKLNRIRKKRDEELKKIFRDEDNRFIIIIGPCSVDNEEAILDYVERLSKLNKKLQDKLFIIPRVYTSKPRTNGEGYKGMLHQPDLDKEPNIVKEIESVRHLHIKIIEKTGLTTADEMLYPEAYAYCDDLLGYVSIGARSVENQQHRLVCSGIDVPVGIKNPTNGYIETLTKTINAVQNKQELIYNNWEVQTYRE